MMRGFVLRTRLVFLLLLSFCNADPSDISPFSQYSSCSTVCRCFNDDGKVSVKCRISGEQVTAESLEFELPPDVYSLDLSNNNLSFIPTRLFQKYTEIANLILDDNNIKNLTSTAMLGAFPSLSYLSFRRNSIIHVESDFFQGLHHLRILNLSLNDLNKWHGNLTHNTQALQALDISGTIHWVPGDNILALPNLQELRGVTWCVFCPNCMVIKPHNLVNGSGERRRKAEECLRKFDEMKFHDFGNKEPVRFIKHRYLPECMCVRQSECEFRQVVMPYFKRHRSLPQHLFLIDYILGPLTIVMNLIIITTILTSKLLRKSPSFVLIGHLGIIDLLVGIYSIWVAHINISNIDGILEEIMLHGKQLQPSTGPIFIAGQLISVSISLFLTLERYLAIIYCMTPSKLLSVKDTHILMLLAWGVAVTFAALPIFGVGGLHYNIERACTPLSYHHDFKSSGSSLILLASLITILVLYVVTLPLYVHIFIFVKKSSNHMGVKRELRLARKIASLVFTNFVFFAFPILLILMFSIFAKFHSDPFDFDGDAFKSTMFKITIGQWLPVTCLSINSMLDPFLYAFRHTQFKREIRRKKTRSSNKVFPFLSVSPPVNTTTGDSMAFNSCPLAGRKNIEVGAPRSKTNNQEETSCVNDQTSG
ncbi:follicle-stimulating hormone receptor-like isoform X2 [Acropora muricata]|uniref:follicle-stimulating hormone receptor-like isoform X2 n=1 Tax=Acropora muricata TaxID=159855 RepID=UPI0034E5E2AD